MFAARPARLPFGGLVSTAKGYAVHQSRPQAK